MPLDCSPKVCLQFMICVYICETGHKFFNISNLKIIAINDDHLGTISVKLYSILTIRFQQRNCFF